MAIDNRIRHLDGIRGIAIAAVVLVHWVGSQISLAQGGYIGVDLFFVLSGFIITTILLKRQLTYKQFIARRIRRLYPPLAGFLIGGTALVWLLPDAAPDLTDALRSAAIATIQGSAVVLASGGHLIPFTVTWSLSVEWMFYLAWPFALTRLARLDSRRAALLCAAATATLYAAALALPARWFYFGPVSRSGELVAGAGLVFAMNASWPATATKWTPRAATVAATVGLPFILLWSIMGPGPYSFGYRAFGFPITIVIAISLIVAGSASNTLVHRVLTWRPLVTVGLISYSLYLWHAFPINLLGSHWLGQPPAVVAAFAVLIVLATTTTGYLLLEKPFTRPSKPPAMRTPQRQSTP